MFVMMFVDFEFDVFVGMFVDMMWMMFKIVDEWVWLVGIGVVVFGVVIDSVGLVCFVFNLGWMDVVLIRLLGECLGYCVLVYIGNDVELGVFFEYDVLKTLLVSLVVLVCLVVEVRFRMWLLVVW